MLALLFWKVSNFSLSIFEFSHSDTKASIDFEISRQICSNNFGVTKWFSLFVYSRFSYYIPRESLLIHFNWLFRLLLFNYGQWILHRRQFEFVGSTTKIPLLNDYFKALLAQLGPKRYGGKSQFMYLLKAKNTIFKNTLDTRVYFVKLSFTSGVVAL